MKLGELDHGFLLRSSISFPVLVHGQSKKSYIEVVEYRYIGCKPVLGGYGEGGYQNPPYG